jgi:hypothetical protein
MPDFERWALDWKVGKSLEKPGNKNPLHGPAVKRVFIQFSESALRV